MAEAKWRAGNRSREGCRFAQGRPGGQADGPAVRPYLHGRSSGPPLLGPRSCAVLSHGFLWVRNGCSSGQIAHAFYSSAPLNQYLIAKA
jgi:hypothetical protein